MPRKTVSFKKTFFNLSLMNPSDNEITDMGFRRMITKICRNLQKDKSRYKKLKEDRDESTKWMNKIETPEWDKEVYYKDVKI